MVKGNGLREWSPPCGFLFCALARAVAGLAAGHCGCVLVFCGAAGQPALVSVVDQIAGVFLLAVALAELLVPADFWKIVGTVTSRPGESGYGRHWWLHAVGFDPVAQFAQPKLVDSTMLF